MHAFKEFMEYLLNEIRGLILPQTLQLNCTHADFEADPPASDIFLNNLEAFQIVFLIIGSVFTFFIFLLAIIQWYFVWTYISIEKRQNKLYFLISLFPISTGCCLVAMYCPRTAILISSLGLLYFLTCLFVLVSLIRHLADGRATLSLMLRQHGKMISFQSPPFCCCMPCLPKAVPTEKNLRRLEWIVLQAPIVRALIVLSEVIAVAEKREHAIVWIQFCDVSSLASLLMAIFGIHTLARLVSDKLSRYGFMGIFRIVDLSLLFFSAQQPILFENIFLRFGVITCGPLLSPHDNARFICNFVIICELFLLSLLATFLVFPSRNNLFDLYHDKSQCLHQTSGSSSTTEETLLTIDA